MLWFYFIVVMFGWFCSCYFVGCGYFGLLFWFELGFGLLFLFVLI